MVAYARMRERVFITGIGCVSAFGIGHAAFTDALAVGASGIVPIAQFDTAACHSHRAAIIQGFDPTAFIAPLKLRRIDAVGRLALACARLLFDDAGRAIGPGARRRHRRRPRHVHGRPRQHRRVSEGLTEHGPTGVPAIIFSNTVSNAPASLCAIEFGLRGPNVTFNQREASSLAALAYAVGVVRDGHVGAMVSGGVDRVEETFFKVLDRFRALSPMRAAAAGAHGAGEEAARPFDRRHNGFVLGEGGFGLLLESAWRRRAAERPRVRRNSRLRHDRVEHGGEPLAGRRFGAGARHAAGARRRRAGPDSVDAVFATANGSPLLDRLEAAAIGDVFDDRPVPVTSLKGALGEFGASGAAGVVAGLSAVARGVMPPTAGFAVGRSRVPRERQRRPAAPFR